MRDLTTAELVLAGILLFVFVYAAILVVVYYRRRWRFDREEQARYDALMALPPEPIDDPCVNEGCGHARGLHYERTDRTRGACRDPECFCAKYVADRPQVLLGVVYDQGEGETNA